MNTSVLVYAPVLAKRKPIFVLMLLGALLLTLLTVMLLLSLFQLPPRIPRFVRIRCVPLYMDAGRPRSHTSYESHYTHASLATLLHTADITVHGATDGQATAPPTPANAPSHSVSCISHVAPRHGPDRAVLAHALPVAAFGSCA